MLLDVSGSGLFNGSSTFLHILSQTLKVVAGGVGIFMLGVVAFIAITIRAVITLVNRRSVGQGFWSFIRPLSWLAGITAALLFALVASVFTGLAFLKLLIVGALIATVTSFIVRETILFLLLKRFGKYLLYFATLRKVHQAVFTNGEEEKPL